MPQRLPIILSVLTALAPTVIAAPTRNKGATAGLAIGVAIGAILLIAIIVLLVLHFRHRNTNPSSQPPRYPTDKHDSTATTINTSTIELTSTDKISEPQIQSMPRRQKSIKDHLMGPLYNDGQEPLPPKPAYTRRKGPDPTDSEMEEEFRLEKDQKRDTIKSFSSRRATRLMMMM